MQDLQVHDHQKRQKLHRSKTTPHVNTVFPSVSCGSGLTGNCEVMYERDNGECTLCMEGYSISKDKMTCQKTAISNCIHGYFDAGNIERCTVCKGYYPSSDGTKCDQKLTAGNCTYGGVNMYQGFGCVNCDSGYSRDSYGKCTTSCTEGCLSCSNGVCLACNHYRGYYDIGPGRCMRESRMFTYGLIGFLMIFWVLM